MMMDLATSNSMMAEEQLTQQQLTAQQQQENRRTLNFLVNPNEDFEPPVKKMRQARDPQSHRIIEKRRRDRMNNCLADLSQLIPSPYLKQGQGRIEKTEIIEMAIRHIKQLRSLIPEDNRPKLENSCVKSEENPSSNRPIKSEGNCNMCEEKFYMGYKEGGDEVMRFLVEVQGYTATDSLCKSLLKHLRHQSIKFEPKCTLPQRDGNAQTLSDTELYKSSKSANDCGMYSDKACGNYAEDLRTVSKPDNNGGNGDDNVANDSNYGSMSSAYSMYNDSVENSAGLDRRSSLEKNMSAYKYKNDIKSRFNADITSNGSSKNSGSDTMSSSSRDSIGRPMDKLSRLSMGQAVSPHDSADSAFSQYPRSDSSLVGSAGQMVSDSGSMSSGNGNGHHKSPKSSCSGSPPLLDMSTRNSHATFTPLEVSSSSETVPAFALHPSGLHYIPIVMQTHALNGHIGGNNRLNSSGPCHLISIPVSFGAPFIKVDNASDVLPAATLNDLPTRTSNIMRNQYHHSGSHSSGSSSRHMSSRSSREFPLAAPAPYNNNHPNSSYINVSSRNGFQVEHMQQAANPMSA